MSDIIKQQETALIEQMVSDLFIVESSYQDGEQTTLSLTPRYDRIRTEAMLVDRLKHSGYDFTVKQTEPLFIVTVSKTRGWHIPRLNIILFIITLFSVYFVPIFLRNLPSALALVQPTAGDGSLSFTEEAGLVAKAISEASQTTIGQIAEGRGFEFTVAIISILLIHEMGHFLAGRRRGIVTSWPYFIPAPNIIGTFGAVIKSKSPFWNRRDLIEVGAAGPIAGWVVAMGWLVYGLANSQVLPAEAFSTSEMAFSLEGESLLMQTLAPLLVGDAPSGYFYLFTEAAFAGWVGLLVTAMNMLPIGQFDGGHIAYGLLRNRQYAFGWMAMAGLIVMGFESQMWWLFAAFGLFFGVAHPPTLDDNRKLSRTSVIMGIVSLVILIVSFTPVPFR
ncbi:MAG: site-2 protease family protein [candidate division Zixibacteria bacterium]|nr:site-2 protease family protein [candidate division Zixibacteria bacterium]